MQKPGRGGETLSTIRRNNLHFAIFKSSFQPSVFTLSSRTFIHQGRLTMNIILYLESIDSLDSLAIADSGSLLA